MQSRPTGGEKVPSALAALERLYSDNLVRHGMDSRSVGWNSADSQLLRFRKLSYVLDAAQNGGPAGTGFAINDLGCGYGALFAYLSDEARFPISRYVGYDISEHMLAAARDQICDERAHFVRASRATEEADYTFASGTFHVRLEADTAEWTDYVKDAIRDMASASRRGIAFNAMSVHVDWRDANLFYADPLEFLEFCRREISPRVALIHDYPLYEWTMTVLTKST
jgi:SAM-dependent methyltransferase